MRGMIFAIDPGTEESAILAFDGKRVHWAKIMYNSALLIMIRGSGDALKGKRVVVELIGHYGTGMPAGQDVFDTCIMIGKIAEAAEQKGAFVSLVKRQKVKLYLCGSPKANDANVRQALIDVYGPQGTKNNPGPLYGVTSHKLAALAIAHYAFNNP